MDSIRFRPTTGKDGQTGKFEKDPGHTVTVPGQETPVKQYKMSSPDPVNDQVPTEDGGYLLYKAARTLAGKKALITGGDSGIGRAIAILYAIKGTGSTSVYKHEEGKDALESQRLVKEEGQQAHLVPADLRRYQACKDVVEKGQETLGRINILLLNHGTQDMKVDLSELSEEQCVNVNIFATNIRPFFLSKCTIPYLSRGDTIMTCGSVNPYIRRHNLLDYTSSKGAFVALHAAFPTSKSKRNLGKLRMSRFDFYAVDSCDYE